MLRDNGGRKRAGHGEPFQGEFEEVGGNVRKSGSEAALLTALKRSNDVQTEGNAPASMEYQSE